MPTRVLNLITQKEIYYCLPPREAVICAFEQYTLKNFNTWTYDTDKRIMIQEGKYTFLCGDWSVLK